MTDPGVPFERTALAWRRTLLAAATVVVLAARIAAESSLLLVAAALAGWVALVGVAYARIRARPAAAGLALPVFALATTGYAGFGVILVLTR